MALPLVVFSIIIVLGGILFLKYGYFLFRQNPESLSVSKLGFQAETPETRKKVEDIGRAFLTGYNTMLTHTNLDEIRKVGEKFPPFLRPFFFEGTAMGYSPKAFFSARYKRENFEEVTCTIKKEYLFLYYIGLGFWYGMRYRHNPRKVEKLVSQLDSDYKYLCYDGFGFKFGFFDYVKNPKVIEKCQKFSGYARHACYQGVGRSLWFVFMSAPERIFEQCNRLEEAYQGDCYSGLGLAVAFTNINNLRFALDFAETIDAKHRGHYYLGFAIAVYTRQMNDNEYFLKQLERLDAQGKETFLNTIEICHDCFDKTSRIKTENSYADWRSCILKSIESSIMKESV